jgi:hypothetical protein
MTNGMGYREELIANIGFGIWKNLLQNLCGSGRDAYVVIPSIPFPRTRRRPCSNLQTHDTLIKTW